MLYKLFFILLFFLFACCSMYAQQTPGELLSKKIADKMTDSLFLSPAQHDSLYAINMRLNQQKMAVRRQFPLPDSTRYYIQRVENTRDSLYLPVLGATKFQLYRNKKSALVNNN